ncbi:WGR domain-containing protein [Phyllobacterium myrsinacearum]|uniref:Putative DNA-binding WGR domain protein n=1 Tax=Phyllobacterium myrsinacearum TaxID=28101 RepID=A0A839EU99_9HYPH|nr:WGR domain-containing protein [Phyllobacterium myrsinacearum]MBA8881758.1 putative DNA-binding WGR domain protein [Phyllobacterium myrsinacearum]
MSVYPIDLKRVSLDHMGGTKSYHFILAMNAKGQSILIRRWGKVKSEGQYRFEKFADRANAERAFGKAMDERERKGYAVVSQSETFAADKDSNMTAFGRMVWAKLPGDVVNFLDPAIDVTGRKAAPVNTMDEDFNRLPEQPRGMTYTSEQIAAAEEERKAEIERQKQSKYSANPNFGRF